MKTVEINNTIDEITQSYQDAFSDLTIDQFNRKENTKVWSIAQNIQHVMHVNTSYFPIFKKIKSGRFSTPLIGIFTSLARITGNAVLESVRPQTIKKTKTIKRWIPNSEVSDLNLLSEFSAHQELLKENIDGLDKWMEKKLIIHSPVSKNVVLYLDTALEVLTNHELRHFHQALRIKESFIK